MPTTDPRIIATKKHETVIADIDRILLETDISGVLAAFNGWDRNRQAQIARRG